MSLIGNLTAIGVLASVFGGAWYGVQPSPKVEVSEAQSGEEAPPSEIYLQIDFIAIPLIRYGQIDGYLMARFYAQTNQNAVSRYGDALPHYLEHAINKGLFAEAGNFEGNNSYKVFDRISEALVESVNEEFGDGTVAHIYASQLDIFAKNAVRTPRDDFNPGG